MSESDEESETFFLFLQKKKMMPNCGVSIVLPTQRTIQVKLGLTIKALSKFYFII